MTKAYQKMFTDFPSHLRKSDQPFTKPDESHPKCDTLNCGSVAEYLDPMDNTLCTSCVERDIQETDGSWEDYESHSPDSSTSSSIN